MKTLPLSLMLLLASPLSAQDSDVTTRTVATDGDTQITADIWVDNWFAMSVDGEPLIEDSTAYQTERSFNGERVTFNADLPMTVAFEFRDFMENDTGLEYIGTGRQQMGDGGAIAQFIDQDGQVLGVTGPEWKCLVVHHAPVDSSCEGSDDPQIGVGECAAQTTQAPDDWESPDFDDSAWSNATTHTSRAVDPKGGYDAISWSQSAALIWGDDLEKDNIVLCRAEIGG